MITEDNTGPWLILDIPYKLVQILGHKAIVQSITCYDMFDVASVSATLSGLLGDLCCRPCANRR